MTKNHVKKSYIPPAQRILRWAFSNLGPVFPQLMARLAYRLWFIPMRFKTPKHEVSANNTATRSTLKINDTKVSILTWGKAPFVFCVQGWSGRGTQVAPFLDDLLSAGYGVISFDGPAHGETPGKKTNVIEMSKIVLGINEKLGPFPAVITHSFAGMIIAYAMKNGLQTKKVVSISPPDTIDTVANVMKRALTIPESVVKIMHEKTACFFGTGFAETISTVNNVSNNNTEVLIIHDENDKDVPWQSGKAVADAYENSTFILTQGLGHRSIIKDADVVKATVEFITR